jgi:uncharacterized protein YndB with AHSA1/START domain
VKAIRTRIHIDATPEHVFSVLADGDRYADWVVGARKIRHADSQFPALGKALKPSLGVRLASVRGSTEVLRVEPPHVLELDARVTPLHARIRFELSPALAGTTVTLDEEAVGAFSRRVAQAARPLILARNAETLWRLRAQVLNHQDVRGPTPTAAENAVPLPRWIGDVTARLFGAAAAVRRDGALHPRGVTQSARVRLTPAGSTLARYEQSDAVVRFSRGAGLPDRLPDINGLAIRFVDARGPGRHRDLLFASAGPGMLRHLLLPSVDFGRSRFSSLLRFSWLGQRVVLTASVRPPKLSLREVRVRAGIEVVVSAVDAAGNAVRLADVTTSEIVDGRPVRFSPDATDDVLAPLGFLNGLRAPAYTASQAVRDAGTA